MNTDRQENAEMQMHINIADQIHRFKNPQNYFAYPTDIVVACACKTMGITLQQYRSKSRKREFVDARIMGSTYLYTNTNLSLNKIGAECGYKDHATVLHYVRKHLEWENDKAYQGLKQSFKDNLRKFSPNYSISMSGVRGLN